MAHNFAPEAYDTEVGVLEITDMDDIGVRATVAFFLQQGHQPLVVETSSPTRGGCTVAIGGEDLFALREMLLELDEELFVRPADPTPGRWNEGDVVVERLGGLAADVHRVHTWVRGEDGWNASGAVSEDIPDRIIESQLDDYPESVKVVFQKSGQDL